MTPEQKQHLNYIVLKTQKLLNEKYTKGVKEHGGNLWEKKGLIDMAIEEAIDQVVYLLTLKKQIEDSGIELGKIEDNEIT